MTPELPARVPRRGGGLGGIGRVLVYADVDLNLIDGSSIWLVSLAELLAGTGELSVTVLRRTREERDVVIRDSSAIEHVTFVDPWRRAERDRDFARTLAFNSGPRLHPATAARLVRILDARSRFDLVIVRSVATTAILGGYPELATRLWTYLTDPLRHSAEGDRERLERIFQRSRRLVCQTKEAIAAFMELLETDHDEPFVLLPPMVVPVTSVQRQLDPTLPRLGYSGKLAPHYMIREMLDAFEQIRVRLPQAEFHVVGDKFHNLPPVPDFVASVTRRLRQTPGVVWHGGVSRTEAANILAGVDVASSWRDESFDSSLELSTKMLEYAALGIPVLLNPTSIHRRIFGSDYPGYVASSTEFAEAFLRLTSSPSLHRRAAAAARRASAPYTYASVRERLLPVLRMDCRRSRDDIPTRILFVGHDFKFLTPLLGHFGTDPRYRVLLDRYRGHVIVDTDRSRRLIQRADIVFCEWALGNAEWYSQNKRPGQLLVVRLHSQEIRLPFIDAIAWENVDALVFICGHHMDTFLERFPELRDRCHLIYNAIDCDRFDLAKERGAELTLGLMGAAPQQKSPHLALDILARLHASDPRYRLSVKGRAPWEYDWLWRRPDERAYYERLYARIEREFGDTVVFEEQGDDVPQWLAKVGFVLSTSEHEGSHQAIAEGMASGSIPVIRNWHGADRLYREADVFRSVDEAVDAILARRDADVLRRESDACRRFARERFDQAKITAQFERLLAGLVAREREAILV